MPDTQEKVDQIAIRVTRDEKKYFRDVARQDNINALSVWALKVLKDYCNARQRKC